MEKKFFSEVVGRDYQKWGMGARVIIDAPTGCGKTFWVTSDLLPWALKMGMSILLCVNRELLEKQIVNELCKKFCIPPCVMEKTACAEFPGISVTTYQAIQKRMKQGQSFPKEYEFVVFDEIHYLLMDSEFNADIQFLSEAIPQMTGMIKIFISATIEEVLPYLGIKLRDWNMVSDGEICTVYQREPQTIAGQIMNRPEELWDYHVPREIPEYQICAYDDIMDVVEMINEDSSEEKYLIFQSNKQKAKSFFDENLHCTYEILTADDKDKKAYQEIVEKSSFSSKVLVTTKILDNGISIKDCTLNSIVLDTTSKTEFIQMLGRRRTLPGEHPQLKIFLPVKNKAFFQGMLEFQIMPALKVLKTPEAEILAYLMEEPEIYKICRNYFSVRDGRLCLNPIALDLLEQKRDFCEEMINGLDMDRCFFLKRQIRWLGIEFDEEKITFLSRQKKKRVIEALKMDLSDLVGKPLGKEEQEAFRLEIGERLNKLIPEFRSRSNKKPGPMRINQALEALNLEFRVTSKPGKKKGEKTVWMIIQEEIPFVTT